MNIQNFGCITHQMDLPSALPRLSAKHKQGLVDQQILTIAKTLYENSTLINESLFLNIKKELNSRDSENNIYEEQLPLGSKYHFFSDLDNKTVRVYISSRNPAEKNPFSNVCGSKKMCTVATKYQINFNRKSPKLAMPEKVIRLHIRPDTPIELYSAFANIITRESAIYKVLSDVEQVCQLYDAATYKGSHGGMPVKKSTMYMERFEGDLIQFKEKLVAEDLNGEQVENHVFSLFEQLLEGLKKIHSKNIVHLDLKPDNLLYKSTPERIKIGIIDFESSHFVDKTGLQMSNSGTSMYFAPEMVESLRTGKGFTMETAKARDMWAAGCILVGMLKGGLPITSLTKCYYDVLRLSWEIEDLKLIFAELLHSESETEEIKDVESKEVKYDFDRRSDMIAGLQIFIGDAIKDLEKVSAEFICPIPLNKSKEDSIQSDQCYSSFESTLDFAQERAICVLSEIKNCLQSNHLSPVSRNKLMKQLEIVQQSTEEIAKAISAKLHQNYALLAGFKPFEHPLLELMRRLFDPNPATRITAEQALIFFR